MSETNLNKQKSWPAKHKVLTAILIVIGLALLGSALPDSTPSSESQPSQQQAPEPKKEEPKKDTSDLNAEVRFSGSAFQITNKEGKTWSNCKLKLNDDYEYQNATIPANDSLIVPFDAFTKKDGTRFNYIATAPKNLFIGSCEGENSLRYGYYTIN